MLSDEERFALYDIRDNILFAREFIGQMSFAAFKDSRLHVYAVTRALEIISEASRRLPDAFRARHPDHPWRAIRDAGNIYRHRYDNVAESAIWNTVTSALTPLLELVVSEIDRT